MIVTADAITWLQNMASASADLVVTDPAYESLEKHRAKGTTTRLGEWFPIFPNNLYPTFFAHLYRVLRPDAHCYVMCDSETMFVIKPIAEACGFKFWKPLVWDKKAIGMGYHWRSQVEFVLFFEKGSRQLHNRGWSDLLEAKRIRGKYPTQKPVEILQRIIVNSSQIGDLVIDPFAGSGSTGVAAIASDRRFAGCDINPASNGIYLQRLMDEIPILKGSQNANQSAPSDPSIACEDSDE